MKSHLNSLLHQDALCFIFDTMVDEMFYHFSMQGGELFNCIQQRADNAFTERGILFISFSKVNNYYFTFLESDIFSASTVVVGGWVVNWSHDELLNPMINQWTDINDSTITATLYLR